MLDPSRDAVQNREQVWKAEQAALAEKKRTEEWRKEIEEEREVEEMRKLQEQAGVKASRPQRVDFLYEGPAAGQQNSEEYLTGKKVEEEKESEAKEVRAAGTVPHPFGANGGLWPPQLEDNSFIGSLLKDGGVSAKNEAFRRLHEDPMFAIKCVRPLRPRPPDG